MSFLKRFEVWLLVILSLGAAVWVFTREDKNDGNPKAILSGEASQEASIKINRTSLERDYSNARLDIELRYRNASPRPLILQAPDVRLLTGDGKEVPPFILPTEKVPQIPAQTAQDVRLRYWLEKGHLESALTLEIRGEKVEVKTTEPLDIESLENRTAKSWQGAIKK